MTYENRWETVDVKVEDGIAWVTLNRPEKKNAMSPTLNREMIDVLETLELDQDARVLVLTGSGDSWTAGMDLKEYFREVDSQPEIVQERIRRDSCRWQWQLLRMYSKPTIAMVNGWCFGGGFSPLVACDLAIAADSSHGQKGRADRPDDPRADPESALPAARRPPGRGPGPHPGSRPAGPGAAGSSAADSCALRHCRRRAHCLLPWPAGKWASRLSRV